MKRVRVRCIGCGKKFWPRSRTGWKTKSKEHVCPYCQSRTPAWLAKEMREKEALDTISK